MANLQILLQNLLAEVKSNQYQNQGSSRYYQHAAELMFLVFLNFSANVNWKPLSKFCILGFVFVVVIELHVFINRDSCQCMHWLESQLQYYKIQTSWDCRLNSCYIVHVIFGLIMSEKSVFRTMQNTNKLGLLHRAFVHGGSYGGAFCNM